MNAFAYWMYRFPYINKQFWYINKNIEILKMLCYNNLCFYRNEDIKTYIYPYCNF